MHRFAIITLFASLIALPAPLVGVDLNGRWLFQTGGFPPDTIVTITQTGSALSIPWVLPFTGTVGAADPSGFTDYSVSWTDGFNQAGFGGRVTPSGNMLDGRAAAAPPFPPVVSAVVATRCTCFDTNSVDGDGCSAACQVEPCWTCVGDPSVCTPTLDGGACDDLSPCTTGETCTAGVCGGEVPLFPCFDLNGPWTRHRAVPDLGVASHTMIAISQRDTDLRIGGSVGTIDPFTGALNVRSVNFNVFCAAFDTLLGSVAPDGLSYSMGGFLQQPQPFAPDVCDTFAQTEVGDHCGNGGFDGTEACDDGNLVEGDGCSALCVVEPCWMCSGTPSICTPVGGGPCNDANGCTINDTCVGDGSCAGTPDIGALCDDGSSCTSGDACTGDGGCAGAPIDCGQCYSCDETLGCVYQFGAPCDDGDVCTAESFCNPAGNCAGFQTIECEPCLTCDSAQGGCVPQPWLLCGESTVPSRSLLHIKQGVDDTKDRFTWRWKKGADVLLSALGDPPNGTDVRVCAYDESGATPALLFRATIPGSSQWVSTPTGFRYKDYSAAADGMTVAVLRAGTGGTASAKLKGKGVSLSNRPYGLPAVPVPLPVRVQLQLENGLCMETLHDASSTLQNDLGVFKAKGTP